MMIRFGVGAHRSPWSTQMDTNRLDVNRRVLLAGTATLAAAAATGSAATGWW
jgi:hypothetical protein